MKPPIEEFRERAKDAEVSSYDRAAFSFVVKYMEEYRTHLQGPADELTDRDEYLDAIIEQRRANPNVAPIFDGIDISKRTAADMRVELQVVIDRYVGRVTNAEAVGVIMMACAHVLFEDSESQEVDGAG